MIAPVLRVIVAGILGGLLLFAIPFLIFKALFFFLIIGLIFRLTAGRRRFGRWGRHYQHFDSYEVYEPFQGKEGLQDHLNQNPKKI